MTLIAEDLLLLLLDDEKGNLTSSSYPHTVLGGAVLLELALAGTVEVRKDGAWRSAKVHPTGTPAPADPVLVSALGTVAERPRTAQDLVNRLGKGLKETLAERLVEQGMLQRRESRVLGLFPRTRWPVADRTHEDEVRRRLTAALGQGLTPDERTGALVALLHAIGRAHKVVPHEGVPTAEVKRRAKEIAEGAWAAKAVKDAINAATAAIVAATAAASVAATGSN
jgi:hypothetical protein